MRKKKGEELYFVTLTSSYLAYLGSYESKVSKKQTGLLLELY
ncbi:hypothetical protein [Leptotrichia hofstadii]|uniref:Uncharacterized protein n=1 Tax=Leptotrichia hofstadii F0254 TaxID=634994 RepID=C9MVV2_9FUSO|nr:hypothetical protein [Leptotrichia hofstadii]EEX75524.1 hypothetical protein GCWU000323_00774 [Leptotrichia hofstadii F0254]